MNDESTNTQNNVQNGAVNSTDPTQGVSSSGPSSNSPVYPAKSIADDQESSEEKTQVAENHTNDKPPKITWI